MLSNKMQASVIASQENQCAEVIIAKRGDLTAVVKRTFPSRRHLSFSLGYARFGMPTIWIVKNKELSIAAAFTTPEYVQHFALLVFAAAAEVPALRAA